MQHLNVPPNVPKKNSLNYSPNSNLQDDNTYLLNKNQHPQQQHHSYLVSPGKTISSCKEKQSLFFCSYTFSNLYSFIIYVYATIIFIIDYIILPISIFAILIYTVFMIINQCSLNNIIHKIDKHLSESNGITSNCQCLISHNHDENKYDECICNGIDNDLFKITNNGLIILFGYILLFFIVEYLSLIVMFFRLLCKCIYCGNDCCYRHCCNCKVYGGYYIFIIGRILGIFACCYFITNTKQNVSCYCHEWNYKMEYCGPSNLNIYMQYLWIYCYFYIILAFIFIAGKTILKCLIRNNRDYQRNKLIRMVLYQQ